jgi:peptidoglycan/xylan/chitin deacetylase (PgdA/CDA1 family)
MWPRSRLLGPNLSRLPDTADFENRVALTFDDGPDPKVTPKVLDILGEHGARATFFVIGQRADQYPEIVSETARRGHRIENHSYTHAHGFAFFGPRALARDIDRAQQSLARASGRRPVFFRAPAGIRNPWFEPVLAQRGLNLASWTRRGYDAVDREAERVTRRLLKGLAARDVLLLHDGSAARSRNGQPVVLEALPRLLDAMAESKLSSIYLPHPRSVETDRPCRDPPGT